MQRNAFLPAWRRAHPTTTASNVPALGGTRLQPAHEVSALPHFDVLAVKHLLHLADGFLIIAARKYLRRPRNSFVPGHFVYSIMVHDASPL
jgi:hypothetical protein